MFIRKSGKTKIMYLPVAASAGAMAEGSMVAFASGTLILATNTTAPFSCVGILRKTVTAADADYAKARLLPVEVDVERNVVWEADVTDGTLVAGSVGLYFDLATADDGSGVDQGASTFDIVQCVKYISASKGQFVLNIGPNAIAKV